MRVCKCCGQRLPDLTFGQSRVRVLELTRDDPYRHVQLYVAPPPDEEEDEEGG